MFRHVIERVWSLDLKCYKFKRFIVSFIFDNVKHIKQDVSKKDNGRETCKGCKKEQKAKNGHLYRKSRSKTRSRESHKIEHFYLLFHCTAGVLGPSTTIDRPIDLAIFCPKSAPIFFLRNIFVQNSIAHLRFQTKNAIKDYINITNHFF